MWSSVAVYAPLSLLTIVLPFPWRYRIIRQWARWQMFMLEKLCGLHFRVEGAERRRT